MGVSGGAEGSTGGDGAEDVQYHMLQAAIRGTTSTVRTPVVAVVGAATTG